MAMNTDKRPHFTTPRPPRTVEVVSHVDKLKDSVVLAIGMVAVLFLFFLEGIHKVAALNVDHGLIYRTAPAVVICATGTLLAVVGWRKGKSYLLWRKAQGLPSAFRNIVGLRPVQLSFEGSDVPTLIGTDCAAGMQQALRALQPQPDKFFICTEPAIYELCCGAQVFSEAALGAPIEVVLMGKGEAEKSAESLMSMTQHCFAAGVTKRSVIVAFGGGIVLNVVGLMAALIYRGIRLVHVPTTLMAQHDVITSLKTAVNLCGRKNNFGTYYQSCLNLVEVGFLRTLPEGQYWSGLGELCKNALIMGGEHAEVFERVMTAWDRGAGTDLALHNEELVRVGIKAKAQGLAVDAKEKTTAMIFEYGHTTAHALERSYPDEVLPHGVAVCWGMLTCSYMAEKMGLMTAEARARHDGLIELMNLTLPEPRPSIETVMEKLMKDNKRGIVMEADDEVSEVLLTKVGAPVQSKSMLHAVKATLVREWLLSMGFEDAES